MASAPYAPPVVTPSGRPATIAWFRVFAAASALLYLGAAAAFGVHGSSVALALATGAFGAFYAVAACVPYRPWGWSVALVAIGLGLASVLVVPALVLGVLWLRPLTRAAFGRL